MELQEIVFYVLASVTVLSAVAVVSMRNVIHSALFLGLSLSSVGGIFALLRADFLFAAQILVYVSGIAVLVLFVVLLAGRASDLVTRQINDQWVAALLVCGVVFVSVSRVLSDVGRVTARPVNWEAGTNQIGRFLLSTYAVPFELVSGVLLVALMGAVIFSRSDDEEGAAE